MVSICVFVYISIYYGNIDEYLYECVYIFMYRFKYLYDSFILLIKYWYKNKKAPTKVYFNFFICKNIYRYTRIIDPIPKRFSTTGWKWIDGSHTRFTTFTNYL